VRYLQSEENGPFVLLYAPLVRQVPLSVLLRSTPRVALVPPRATVLFVRSQLGEFPDAPRPWMNYEGLAFDKLGNIDTALQHFQDLETAGRIRLELANLSKAAPGKAIEMLIDRVNEIKPDVLHYAGHAWSDGRSTVTLILPGAAPDEAMGLTLLRVPVYEGLRDTKLVYLSAALIIALLLSVLAASSGYGMEIEVSGDQLILSGPVVARDYDEVANTLSVKPEIKMVVLRNSPGGDAPTGYHLGELFRQKSLKTAVSGYCYSSCSRLFLGGKDRFFTDDYRPEYTEVGFHGHYDRKGDLNAAYVAELHLKDWIIRYSDGKADAALVERWINIPRGTGLIHFYNPALVKIGGYSTFMCQGTEPGHPRIFDCERIPKTALDLGVATSTTLVHSHDQQQIRATMLKIPSPSGFAPLGDDSRLPGISEAGREQYRRFLAAPSPRAFALAPSGIAWAWSFSRVPDAAWRALTLCAERAHEPCRLYAVDDAVVWLPLSK
jgi:hypothetical protein